MKRIPRNLDAHEEAEAEWRREVARRTAELDANAVSAIPWADVRSRLLAVLDKERRMLSLEQELLTAAKGPRIEVAITEIRKKGLITAFRKRVRRT